jgi:hypothetical protein
LLFSKCNFMDILEKLFSSPSRVKVMRFFLMNPDAVFTVLQVAKTLRVAKNKVRSEFNLLKSIGFLEKGIHETQIVFKTKKKPKKKKEAGAKLNNLFPFLRPLRALIVEANSVSRDLLSKRFRRLGKSLKLVILSGVFVSKPEEGVLDILVVSDSTRKGPVEKILKKIESEIGRELSYSLLSTEEFKYRQGMYDKFIIEIFEREHDVLVDNLNNKPGV